MHSSLYKHADIDWNLFKQYLGLKILNRWIAKLSEGLIQSLHQLIFFHWNSPCSLFTMFFHWWSDSTLGSSLKIPFVEGPWKNQEISVEVSLNVKLKRKKEILLVNKDDTSFLRAFTAGFSYFHWKQCFQLPENRLWNLAVI